MPMISLADVRAAAARIEGRVLRTPMLPSDAISRATGAQVFLKLDNLQATGAFKERGAANRLALLTELRARSHPNFTLSNPAPTRTQAGLLALLGGLAGPDAARPAVVRLPHLHVHGGCARLDTGAA